MVVPSTSLVARVRSTWSPLRCAHGAPGLCNHAPGRPEQRCRCIHPSGSAQREPLTGGALERYCPPMLLLGLILIALGGLAIVAAVFTVELDGSIELLGTDISALALF